MLGGGSPGPIADFSVVPRDDPADGVFVDVCYQCVRPSALYIDPNAVIYVAESEGNVYGSEYLGTVRKYVRN